MTEDARTKRPASRKAHWPAGRSRLMTGAASRFVWFILIITFGGITFGALAQKRPKQRPAKVSLTSHTRDSLSAEAREMVELASAVVCKERLSDPKGSAP